MKGVTVTELFASQAARKPHAIAVIDGDNAISYGELLQRSEIVAYNLITRGIKAGDTVALSGKQNADLIAVILGTIRMGAAYVPIDKNFPESRKKMIIDDCKASLVVHDSPGSEPNSISTSELLTNPSDNANEIFPRYPNPHDLVYIIYTSGTTGRPKGVRISHGALHNYIMWAKNQYLQKKTHYHFPLFTSLAFDLSVTSLFLPLISGNTMIIHDAENSVQSLLDAFSDPRVNIIKCTPSQLNFIDAGVLNHGTIETIIVGGENLSAQKAFEVSRRCDHKVAIFNEYGPTETTVGCTCHQYDPYKDTSDSVPLGKPVANTLLFLVDEHGKVIEGPGKGELYVGGVGLATGYVNEAQTKEKFITFHTTDAAVDVYKTGDMVARDEHGNLFFQGRIDDQVKIGGYRVELPEIEAAIMIHEGVQQVAVFPDETSVLCACIKRKQGVEVTVEELQQHLTLHLPYWMMPRRFQFVNEFPVTLHGKTDRKKLRQEFTRQHRNIQGSLFEKLRHIFSQVLGINDVDPNENFFRLGGDSIKAMQVINLIRHETGRDLPVSALFTNPTLRGIELTIQHSKNPAQPDSMPDKLPTGIHLHISEAQRQIFTDHAFAPSALRYNLTTVWRFDKLIDADRLRIALENVIQRHEALQTRFVWSKGDIAGILSNEPLQFTKIDVKDAGSADKLINSFAKPFDLAKSPLIRALFININNNRSVLVLDKHHIACDGLSEEILIRDVCAFYEGRVPSRQEMRFTDYVCWQHSQKEKREEALNIFWKNHLNGRKPLPTIPPDFVRSMKPSLSGGCITGMISEKETSELKQFSAQHGITLFTVFFGLYYHVLKTHTGNDDIPILTYTAGRPLHSLQNTVGMFVNTIPVRIRKSEENFAEQLQSIRHTLGEVLEHQDYPLRKILKASFGDHNHVMAPVFNAAITWDNYLTREFHMGTAHASVQQIKHHSPVTDLSLELTEHGDHITIEWIYNKDAISPETVKQLHGHYMTSVNEFVTSGKLNHKTTPKNKTIDSTVSVPNNESVVHKSKPHHDRLLETVVKLFARHTGNEYVKLSDDFFKTGGDSLSFISFLHQLSKDTGNTISPATAILNPTPVAIARLLQQPSERRESYGTWLRTGGAQSVFCFPPALGNAITFRQLSDRLSNSNVYAFDFKDTDDLIVSYADEIMDACSDIPLFLLGYSGGGNLAFETAKLLEARGKEINGLILVDAFRKKEKVNKFPQAIEQIKQRLKNTIPTSSDEDDWISKTIDTYYTFINFILEDHRGKIKTDIHLVTSEDRSLFREITTDEGIPYFGSWQEATLGKFREYSASGLHHQVLQKEYLKINIEIIKHIMANEKIISPRA